MPPCVCLCLCLGSAQVTYGLDEQQTYQDVSTMTEFHEWLRVSGCVRFLRGRDDDFFPPLGSSEPSVYPRLLSLCGFFGFPCVSSELAGMTSYSPAPPLPFQVFD